MKLLCLISLLRNAAISNKKKFLIPFSKNTTSFLEILKYEKYIYTFKKISNKEIMVFIFSLRKNNRILNLQKFGKPSRFIYFSCQDLFKINKTVHTIILSTNYGIITHTYAIKINCGGKLIGVLL
jgi:ribosomal protein S8